MSNLQIKLQTRGVDVRKNRKKNGWSVSHSKKADLCRIAKIEVDVHRRARKRSRKGWSKRLAYEEGLVAKSEADMHKGARKRTKKGWS